MNYKEVSFVANGGAVLRGRLYLPEGPGPHPAAIAHSGIGGVAENMFDLAELFISHGLALLAYDHRNMGYSDGEPRQLVDPLRQSRDIRTAVTYLRTRDEIAPGRIGCWGISLGGATGLIATALDKRIRALVSIVPPVSGRSARDLFPPQQLAELEGLIEKDRLAQLEGSPAMLLQTNGRRTPGGPPVIFEDPEGIEFTNDFKIMPSYRNELALETLDYLFEMEATPYAERITQPLLMVTATEDTVAPVEEALEMYSRIPNPKEHWEYEGQHYGILTRHYREIVDRTAEWLSKTL